MAKYVERASGLAELEEITWKKGRVNRRRTPVEEIPGRGRRAYPEVAVNRDAAVLGDRNGVDGLDEAVVDCDPRGVNDEIG